VGKELRFINRMHDLFAFYFDDQNAIDDHVGSEATIQLHTFIEQWHRFLALDPHFEDLQLMGEAGFVSRFQKSGAEFAVYLDRRTDDLSRRVTHG
jgi:hypothetical protein